PIEDFPRPLFHQAAGDFGAETLGLFSRSGIRGTDHPSPVHSGNNSHEAQAVVFAPSVNGDWDLAAATQLTQRRPLRPNRLMGGPVVEGLDRSLDPLVARPHL